MPLRHRTGPRTPEGLSDHDAARLRAYIGLDPDEAERPVRSTTPKPKAQPPADAKAKRRGRRT